MKKGILIAGLFVLTGTTYAQIPGIKVPAKTSAQSKVDAKAEATYNQLVGKDVATVMQTLNMKDSIGKTMYAYMPQAEKGTRYLLLKVPNGDQLMFKNNRMTGFLPK
ncbi:MAG: hypothetical protein V4590_14280 [Bacteroidota bacterium]